MTSPNNVLPTASTTPRLSHTTLETASPCSAGSNTREDLVQKDHPITQLRFTTAILPHDTGKQSYRALEGAPYPCPVCLNLSPHAAKAMYMLRPESISVSDWNKPTADIVMTMYELEESAVTDECPSCMVLHAAARDCGEGHFDHTTEREICITFRDDNMLRMVIETDKTKPGSNSSVWVPLEIFTSAGSACPWPAIGTEASTISTSLWPIPGGEASVVPVAPMHCEYDSIIKENLRQCENDHPYCNIGTEFNIRLALHSQRPKRFVYVGVGDSDLCLQESPDNNSNYIALSYCWGTKVDLTLLRSNHDGLRRRLPWGKLLQTHKDAILVARELGIHYLWIDALCIVQDDVEDKAEEIANMASIYANAYLTISATGGSDGAAGLFTVRQPTYSIVCTDVDGYVFNISVRTPLDHSPFRWDIEASNTAVNGERKLPTIFSTIPQSHADTEFPVFTRGWTFQERLLSPRIIHFTKNELVWECLGMTSCECGVMDQSVASETLIARRYTAGLPHDVEVRCGKLERSRRLARRLGFLSEEGGMTMSVLPARFRNDYALIFTITGWSTPKEPWSSEELEGYMPRSNSNSQWRNLVSEYSERTLGFVTDVLPAISGFARVWQARQEQSTRYLAGIWEDDLKRGVLWKAGGEDKSRPAEYLAPTWSWACIRRPVEWISTNYPAEYRIDIIDVSCESVYDDNPFGPVSNGSLTIRGRVLRTSMLPIIDQDGKPYARVSFATGIHTDYFDSTPEIIDIPPGTEILSLWWSTDVSDARTGNGFERALLLRPCASPGEKLFTRVGVMSFTGMDELMHLFEETTLKII